MAAAISKKYVKLDQREHVLTRPGMYIGSVEPDDCDAWMYCEASKKMVKKRFRYVPGLFKIFDEILVNAIDHAVRLKNKPEAEVGHHVKNIKVHLDRETGIIEITNDGDGIEVVKHPQHGVYIPELIFGNMLTSTNYDDQEEKVIGGQNGIGAKACNIFSEFFEVETIDALRKQKYVQKFETNMSAVPVPTISKYTKKPYTTIRFKPDYPKFQMCIGDPLYLDMFEVMKKRVYDACAVTDKDITVWLNETKMETKTFEKYVDLYLGSKTDHTRVHEIINDRWEVVASYNDFAGFEQVSFVNGIWTLRGGKHVDYICNQITKKLIDLVCKRRKDVTHLKPQTVKDNLILFVKATIVNPSFDSQSKETLTSPVSKFGSKAEISDKFIDKLYKSGIVDKLVEIANIQGNADLKKTDGKKKDTIRGIYKLDDANWAGTAKSSECTLILTEGDSAKTMVIAGLSALGRDRYGVFPLRGKLLNVKDMSLKKILENEEINHLKKILGLESGKTYTSISDLRYGKIMVLTDQDVDGSHIKGLLFNMFHTLWPSLVRDHSFLTSMLTPIVKVVGDRGRQMFSFYNLTDFTNWKAENTSGHYNVKYYKGLGTSTEDEAIQYFTDMKTVNYVYTGNTSDEKLELAFNKKRADDRKNWLGQYDRQLVLDYADSQVPYETFVDRELIHFSNYDLERSIPSLCDGFKVSQRKILYSCFKKNLTDKEIRVAQLAAYVSENAAYHHGEASLQGAITAMAQNFVGSNNINLLLPNGQFGSRVCGGKDASQPRYIHTLLNPLTLNVFKKEDQAILTYLDDDGLSVEPHFYMPILPMVLVNGALGIGTGFSTNVPCYNPKDIVSVLRRLLAKDDVSEDTDLAPWYAGFSGTINLTGAGKHMSRGVFQKVAPTKIRVTELPVGSWTEDFKIMLEDMLDSKDSKDSKEGKEKPLLKGYESNYTHCTVDFTLHFHSAAALDALMVANDDGVTKLEQTFKLVSPKMMSTTNMYLFNEKGHITRYDRALDIIQAFYGVRMKHYDMRKQYMLSKLQHDIDVLNNKIRFIRSIIDKELDVSIYTKAGLEARLEEQEYMKVDGGFDYLVRIPIYNITKDKVEDLEADIASHSGKLEILRETTLEDMWRQELDDFEHQYDKYLQTRQTFTAPKKKAVKKKQ